MMNRRKIWVGLLVLFIFIQFVQPTRNKSNQSLQTDLVKLFVVPSEVLKVLEAACFDCHSNNTKYPWYSWVQPFGWILANHIRKGKEDLNFSEFGSYSVRRQLSKLTGVANSINDGSMPLSSYTLLHKTARLSKDEKALLINWVLKTRDSLRMKL